MSNKIDKYSDNYAELRKVTARLPVIPLQYDYKHKGVINEIVVSKDKENIFIVDDDYELLPLGKNVKVITKYIFIRRDVTLVPLGETFREGDHLSVTQNGLQLAEGVHYKKNKTSISGINGYKWNGSFEEILFIFTIIRNQEKGMDVEEEIIIPQDGRTGTILIKVDNTICWASYDLTDELYEGMITANLGSMYVDDTEVDRYMSEPAPLPETFPQEGTTGQVLVRTENGIGWCDINITKETYVDAVTNSIGVNYIAEVGDLMYDNIDTVELPEGLPPDGEPGDLLYKTDTWCKWGLSDLSNVEYRRTVSNIFGDGYVTK